MPEISGPRTWKKQIVIVAALAFALAGAFPHAIAVHDDDPQGSGIFELGDGAGTTGSADILGSASQLGPDWEDIFDADGNVEALQGGVVATFLKDDTAQKGGVDATTFASSASSNKNNDPISDQGEGWSWTSGNVPAKDDLVNTYAWAGALPSNGHAVVYVGIERLAPEGDSHVDIELFQDEVGLDEAPPCNDPGADATPCGWIGVRMDGDVLVSMDFLNGGGIGQVSVRVFNASAGGFVLVETLEGEGCNTPDGIAGDMICAFNNGAPVAGGSWPNYDRQGKTITQIDTNGFTEFGLDLSVLNGGVVPCISTILAKTRSSQSFTAELMDFSGPHDFDLCSAAIAIGPDGTNLVGERHTFNVTVNTSVAGVTSPAPNGTVVNVTLTDSAGAAAVLLSDTCATGTLNGACNVTFTSYSPGTVTGHASANVTFGGSTLHVETDATGQNSGDAVKRFVGRPSIKLSGLGYDNTPTDAAPSAGIVNGTTNFTIRLKNFGPVAGTVSAFLNVSIPAGSLASGTFTYLGATGTPATAPAAGASCVTLCTISWAGVSLAPGAEVVLKAEVRYQGVPDGTLIRAALDSTYSASGSTWQASGSPAMVQFTVQAD